MKILLVTILITIYQGTLFGQNNMVGYNSNDGNSWYLVELDETNCVIDTLNEYIPAPGSIDVTDNLSGISVSCTHLFSPGWIQSDSLSEYGLFITDISSTNITFIEDFYLNQNPFMPREVEYDPISNCVYSISIGMNKCLINKFDLNSQTTSNIAEIPNDYCGYSGPIQDRATLDYNNKFMYTTNYLGDSIMTLKIDLQSGNVDSIIFRHPPVGGNDSIIFMNGAYYDNNLGKVFALGVKYSSSFDYTEGIISMDLDTKSGELVIPDPYWSPSRGAIRYTGYDEESNVYCVAREKNNETTHYTYDVINGNLIDSCFVSYDNYPFVYKKCATLSIQNNLPTKNKRLIYPNPSNTGLIQINIDINHSDIKVYSIEGKQINFTKTNNAIDISDNEKGVYLISIDGEVVKYTYSN